MRNVKLHLLNATSKFENSIKTVFGSFKVTCLGNYTFALEKSCVLFAKRAAVGCFLPSNKDSNLIREDMMIQATIGPRFF